MRISSIELEGFTVHASTRVELPAVGAMLVTGDNGSGKSSLLEAVSTAGWGETLRGTPPWQVKGRACFTLEDGLVVERARRGKAQTLRFEGPEESAKYDTPSKAQEALERRIGEQKTWALTHVFSASDEKYFTRATDGERKRLLEQVLALDRFDPALDACRADMKAARDALNTVLREQEVQDEKVRGVRARLRDAEEALESQPTEGPSVADAAETVAAAREKLRALRGELSALQHELSGCQVSLRQLPSGDVCGTCGQSVKEALRAKVTAENERLRENAKALRAPLLTKIEKRSDRVARAEESLAAAQELLHGAKAREAKAAQAKAAEGRCQALRDVLADAEDLAGDLTDEVARLTGRVTTLRHVEKVLGLQGVRAHLLGQALSGVEGIANAWLARFAATGDVSLQLKLHPYTEDSKGVQRASIAFEIEGAGGGYGYKASSGGERRRIDIALLLALAEVASAAHGRASGTLFFDEVFDALDEDGVQAADELIGELAATTNVVVISHRREIIERLNVAKHIHMKRGKAEVL